MRWLLAAAALVIAANAAVLIAVARERAGPVTRTPVAVCADMVIGGGDSEDAPALRLRARVDTAVVPAGWDSAGLSALGVPPAVSDTPGVDTRWPRPRPAWVRLRQTDSLQHLAVVAVAARREDLAPDTTSLVIRGRVDLRRRPAAPPTRDSAPAGRAPAPRGAVYATVVNLFPSALHLDRRQSAALQRRLGEATGCTTRSGVIVATGAHGGIWVAEVP